MYFVFQAEMAKKYKGKWSLAAEFRKSKYERAIHADSPG